MKFKKHLIIITIFGLCISQFPVDTIGQTSIKSIVIHDNQYDCYNSMEYTITDSSIYIDNYSEHGDMYDSNYTPEVLFDITLSDAKRKILASFMQNFPLDSMKTLYSSGENKDCNEIRQIYIEINWNGKKKNIQIEDCYQRNLAKLFETINLLIPKGGETKKELSQHFIEYKPEEFGCKQ